MIGLIKQSSVKVADELSIAREKSGKSLGSTNNILHKRKLKNQNLVENNARALNVLTFLNDQFEMN